MNASCRRPLIQHLQYLGLGLVLASSLPSWAEEPPTAAPTPRTTKIIFSGAKSDPGATNYTESRSSLSPFQKLESELAKPFDLGDAVPKPVYRPARQLPQSPATPPKRSWKDQQLEQAESRFLNPELGEDAEQNDPYGLPSHKADPYKKKNPTALDRYYDRLDRERQLATNSTSASGLFGNAQDKTMRPDFGLESRAANPLANPGSATNRASNLGLYRSSISEERPAANRSLFRDAGANNFNSRDGYGSRSRSTTEPSARDNYRSWSEPGYQRPTPATAASGAAQLDPYAPPLRNTAWPAPTPSWSSTKPATDSTSSSLGFSHSPLAPRLTGTPQTPQGAPDFASATTVSPRRAPAANNGFTDPAKLPGFKLPQRSY